MSVVTKKYKYLLLGVFVLSIVACSSTPEVDEDYKGIYSSKSPKKQTLEMPPDLVAPDSSNALSIPLLSETSSSYSSRSNLSSGLSNNILPSSSSGVRFVRDGSVFWLEINAKPDEIWEQVRGFFKELGFTFVNENPTIGLIETNWLESRLGVPTGWFSSWFGDAFSTGLMDKYRIRIERTNKENVNLLFITHQGLEEQSYSGFSETDVDVRWLPRASDPELEAEMLQRFLIFRGIAKVQAKKLVSNLKEVVRVKLVKDKSTEVYKIEVNEIFPRTWRRISIALDRMGVVVEDRNRNKGIYYIKTTEDFIKSGSEDTSWFASIFSSSKEQLKEASFQLIVDDNDKNTVITILNESGEKDVSKTGYYVLKKLTENLH